MTRSTKNGALLATLFIYQLVAVCVSLDFRWNSELSVPVTLLFGFTIFSGLRICYPTSSGVSVIWRALFAGNVAFFTVGLLLSSVRWPGTCVRIPFLDMFAFLVAQYWPTLILRRALAHWGQRPGGQSAQPGGL